MHSRLRDLERDENTCRLDFTPEEAVLCGRAIEELERPKAKERQRKHGGTAPGKKSTSAKLAEVNGDTGETRDKVATAVGMKRTTYDKAKAVVVAAERDPKLRGVVYPAGSLAKATRTCGACHGCSSGRPAR